jgi:K+-transporting ATPase ATPase A chain
MQCGLFLLVVLVLVQPVGGYLQRVFAGQRTFLDPVLRPIERGIYRLAGVDAERQMDGKQYAIAFVLFGLLGTLMLYAILRLQAVLTTVNGHFLMTSINPDLAFNTAASFTQPQRGRPTQARAR